MKTALAILLVLFAISAGAQTKSITIGKLTYDGYFVEGGIAFSAYEYLLDTSGITKEPIVFHNVILNIKGATSGTYPQFPEITTGPGCGTPGITVPCDVLFRPSGAFTCAKTKDGGLTWTQTCISIALQFISLTGKNFSVTLVDGSKFCVYGVNNVYLEAQPDQRELDPQCNAQSFCKGISVPIILKAAPRCTCN